MTQLFRARVPRETQMSEEMFDALMGFEVKHLRTPYATFTREDVVKFLQETASPEIVAGFKDYYLSWAPEATNLS